MLRGDIENSVFRADLTRTILQICNQSLGSRGLQAYCPNPDTEQPNFFEFFRQEYPENEKTRFKTGFISTPAGQLQRLLSFTNAAPDVGHEGSSGLWNGGS